MDVFREDPGLLLRFRAGHKPALDRVYRAFVPAVRGFIRRGFAFQSHGRNLFFRGNLQEGDLDDVVQETFRRAFGPKAREAYDGVRPFKNYLFTIARNALINDLIQRQRHVLIGDGYFEQPRHDERTTDSERYSAAPLQLDTLSSPSMLDDHIEALEIQALVETFVAHLDSQEYELFHVRFLGGSSQEASALVLGCSRSRVRQLESRMRRDFWSHIAHSGYLLSALRPCAAGPSTSQRQARKPASGWKRSTSRAHEVGAAA